MTPTRPIHPLAATVLLVMLAGLIGAAFHDAIDKSAIPVRRSAPAARSAVTAPSPVVLFRSSVRPGEVAYLWSASGHLRPERWILKGPNDRTLRNLKWESWSRRRATYWDEAHHHGVRIPADAREGTYTLHQADGPAVATLRIDDRIKWGDFTHTGRTFTGRLPHDQGTLFADCTIDLSRGGHAHHSGANVVYLRCRFVGVHPDARMPLVIWAPGQVAVIDCVFDSTARGIVVQSHHGARVGGLLVTGCIRSGIDGEDNGMEGTLLEGKGEISDVAILHDVTRGGRGPDLLADPQTPLRRLTVRDFDWSGLGVWLLGDDTQDCVFLDGEVTGGCLTLARPAGIRFENVGVAAFRRTRGNQVNGKLLDLLPVRDMAGDAIVVDGVAVGREAVSR